MAPSLRALIHQFWEKAAVYDLAIAKGGSEEAKKEADNVLADLENIARDIKAHLLSYLQQPYTPIQVGVLHALGTLIYNEDGRTRAEFQSDVVSKNLEWDQKRVDSCFTEIDKVLGDLQSDTTDSNVIPHIERWISTIHELADVSETKSHRENEKIRLNRKLGLYKSRKEANAVAEATTREVGITRKAEDAEVES